MSIRRRTRHSAIRVESLEARQLLAADLVISEFMAVNDSTLANEAGEFVDWIEIHNATDQPASLNGWYLTDDADQLGRWQFPDVSIPADGYQVVWASGEDRSDPAGELHTNFKLSGSGEFLALVQPDAQTVEFQFAPEYPSQVADVAYGVSSDQSQIGFFTLPSPGSENTQLPVDDPLRTVVINEIMYHPAESRTDHEFIELVNVGTDSVDLEGWRISGGVDFVFPLQTLSAGEHLVISADPVAFRELYGGEIDVVGPWTGQLSNSSDRLTLRDLEDRRIDRVTYADEGDWAVRARGPLDEGSQGWVWSDEHDGGGKSLELRNAAMPNELGQNWGSSEVVGGSPGAVNSIREDNSAPMIWDREHSPPIPSSTDTVTITARVIDESRDGINVTLHWRADGAEAYTETPMVDDGQNGDRLAGDGVYQAMIPPQADMTVVEFYISATDVSELQRTWPAPTLESGQATNALFQVIDAFDENAVWGPESHPAYFEIMTGAERSEFTDIKRASDAQMNATFISVNQDGVDVRYNTGVRIRGSGSRRANPPNNRINFASDDPWNGVTAINLNVDNVQDQIAGSILHRIAGLPAAEAKAVTMYSNGVDLREGRFYAHVEPLNNHFAEKHFPSDDNGNLYKGRRPNESPPGGRGAGLVYYEDAAAYVSYTKLTNESAADWSDVINLTDVLNNAPDETYLEQVAEVADIDQWLRFFGFNALLGNTEGGLVNGDRYGDDYAMYRGIDDARFVMIPHDLDSLFSGVTRGIYNAANVPALRRLIYHPEIQARYVDHLHDLADNVLLTADARSALENGLRDVLTPNQINNIFVYLQDRANYVKSVTPETIRIEHHLDNSQGLLVSQSNMTELHGAVNYRANSVTVNGMVATVAANSTWQLGSYTKIPVARGSTWSYLDNGSDQGTAWRESDFEIDETWGEGRAQLGYGDGDERTSIGFGEDPDNRHVTSYFRQEFEVTNADRYLTLILRLLRDDGAVVYLNGQEVVRSNMPEGEINFDTLAAVNVNSRSAERAYTSYVLDPALLNEGKNVLAVEVHQFAVDSPDISFDLSLEGRYQSFSGIPLQPGVNRLTVRSFTEADGQGQELATEFVDVWYDDGSVTSVTDDLPAGETVWAPENGPYQLTGEIRVPEGATLRIEPGTSVYFEPDTRVIVNGVLVAEGTEDARIRFTSVPGQPFVPDLNGLPDGPARWKGIQFRDSGAAENKIAFADIEYAQDNNGAIGVINSSAVIDDVSFAGTHRRMVYGNNASLVVRNSDFPDMFAEDEDPAVLGLDNISEQIKIVGRPPADGQLIIQNNVFGSNKGHNDVIDADSHRVTAGPILQILDNVFAGAGDELLDLGGDVYVAGNLFRNVSKDDSTSDRGYANAISTGDAGANTTIVVARNVFYDVDHAINLKRNAATIFENNTVVKVHPDFLDRFDNPSVASAINFYVDEPGATFGKGAYAAGNIFWDTPRVFGNVDLPADRANTALQLEHNLLSPEVAQAPVGERGITTQELGIGNVIGDPRIADPSRDDFSLQTGSAALSAYFGMDQGALVPNGAWIAGEPDSVTADSNAMLTVGGPGIFAYQYRINDGEWSETIDIGTGYDPNGTVRTSQITLENLAEGEYTVEVLGRDFAGNWQAVPTRSQTWNVQPQLNRLQINEVLATNQQTLNDAGARPDLIELYNGGNSEVALQGLSLTDDPSEPRKFVFDQQTIAPGDYLTLYADDRGADGIHLGFSLRREGEGVYLFAAAADEQPPALIDSVEFGLQIPDLSIGRVGPDRGWRLTEPTFGAPNQPALTAGSDRVTINEWLADATDQSDFIELYNADPLPVDLSGHFLSDAVDGMPTRHEIAPLSFIAGRGFTVFRADGDPGAGANHLDFGLSSDLESLGLSTPDLQLVDAIAYQPQISSISQGRIPDGAAQLAFFELPSPGWVNGGGIPGDFNRDALVDVADIDLICQALRLGEDPDGRFDVDRDGRLTGDDVTYLVQVILNTSSGDANLDGVFDSSDLVVVFQAGVYEDDVAGNASWATGDWDCDGDFTTRDLVVAFREGAYAAAEPRAAQANLNLVAAGLSDLPTISGNDQERVQGVKAANDAAADSRPARLDVLAVNTDLRNTDAVFAITDWQRDDKVREEMLDELALEFRQL